MTFVLDQQLGYAVKRLQQALRRETDERLDDLGLNAASFAALVPLLDEPVATNAELARAAFVAESTMHQMLDQLEERGLVLREPGGRGRARGAGLTAEGRRVTSEATRRMADVEAALRAGLDSDQVAAVLDWMTASSERLEGA